MSVFDKQVLVENPTQAGDTGVLEVYAICDSLVIECKGSGYKFHIEAQADPFQIDNWSNVTGIQLDGYNTVDDITVDGIYQYSIGGLYKIRVYIDTPGSDLIVYAAATKHMVS